MNALVEKVRSFAGAHDLPDGGRLLVGISGGVDSIVLADVLQQIGLDITAVHVNYRLRSEASDEDEAFVRRWCGEHGIPLVVRHFETSEVARESHLSIQEAARELRYGVFAEEAERAGVGTVAVGHQRDDLAETVLLNLFRGTGIEGLAGIPVERALSQKVRVVRPLLGARRSEIEAYAGELCLEWREDATNLKSAYRRGALRGQVIPLIEEFFGEGVRENIARSADLVRAYLERSLEGEIEAAFVESAGDRRLRLDSLSKLPDVMRGRVILEGIRRWIPEMAASAHAVQEIEKLLDAQVGRRIELGSCDVWRERECLVFSLRPDDPAADSFELTTEEPVDLDGSLLQIDLLDAVPKDLDAGRDVAHVDADILAMPLLVRRWRPGDRFIPLGMQHSRKLSDFLTDERVPSHMKARTYVVESNGRIVWVVGCRISDEFRIRDTTKNAAQLTLERIENSSV